MSYVWSEPLTISVEGEEKKPTISLGRLALIGAVVGGLAYLASKKGEK